MEKFSRCCNCRHFDEFDSLCRLNPPAYVGQRPDEYGDLVQHWAQPLIEYEWAEWCSQWKAADESQTESQRAEQIRSLIDKHKDALAGRESHE